MRSILIVTEQFTIGGLETHIRGEILALTNAGYKVHLAVGRLFSDSLLPDCLVSVRQGVPFESTSTSSELVVAIENLRRIIRDNSIDCIHVHPFTSIIPAFAAAELEGIPVAITLHGPASLASYGPIYDFLLREVILPNSRLVVAVSPEVIRYADINIQVQSIAYLPNAVTFSDLPEIASNSDQTDPRWLVVSRLDQFKIKGVLDFCAKAKQVGIPGVLVVGDGPAKEQLFVDLRNSCLEDYVDFYGASNDVHSLMRRSAGVAGMGRVVLEAVECKKPAVLVGCDGVKGVIDRMLLELAADSNFSGRGLPTINEVTFREQFKKVSSADVSTIYDFAKINFSEANVWGSFLDRLASLPPQRPALLSSFYHSLAGNPIQNELPYSYSPEVLDRLGRLVFCVKYFEPRLSAIFSHYRQQLVDFNLNQVVAERDGQIVNLGQAVAERDDRIVYLNQIVAERDGQIVNLGQAVAERDDRIAYLNQIVAERDGQIRAILNSHSWRLTQPLRLANRLVRSVSSEKERYSLLKAIFWRLPEALRHRLNRQRYAYVSKRLQLDFFEETDNRPLPGLLASDQHDWISKANQVGRIAIIPCGFEFDELVNQRPINAAKYFAEQGYFVLFIAWQWSPIDTLSKGCNEVLENIYQVPLFEFITSAKELLPHSDLSVFLITMPAAPLVGLIPLLRERGLVIVYDIMDEWEAFKHVGQAPWFLKTIEEQLVLQSDFVCAVSPSLCEKFSHFRSDIKAIGNGYTPEIIGLENKYIAGARCEGRKVVGYFGHLTDAWFDWKLIFQLAQARSDVDFEIVGYGEPDWVRRELARLPNIHLLGKVLPRDLNCYVSRWSVGMIPFIEGVLAEAVDPIKIYEYLYFGLPVIVTGIRHLGDYPMTYYSDRNDALNALGRAIGHKGRPEYLDVFLQKTTWRARFDTLVADMTNNQNMRNLYAC